MQEASRDVTAVGNRRIGTLARVASVDVTLEAVCTGQHTAIERATVHAWNIAQCHCIIVIVATLFTAGWSWYTETLAIMGNSAPKKMLTYLKRLVWRFRTHKAGNRFRLSYIRTGKTSDLHSKQSA